MGDTIHDGDGNIVFLRDNGTKSCRIDREGNKVYYAEDGATLYSFQNKDGNEVRFAEDGVTIEATLDKDSNMVLYQKGKNDGNVLVTVDKDRNVAQYAENGSDILGVFDVAGNVIFQSDVRERIMKESKNIVKLSRKMIDEYGRYREKSEVHSVLKIQDKLVKSVQNAEYHSPVEQRFDERVNKTMSKNAEKRQTELSVVHRTNGRVH